MTWLWLLIFGGLWVAMVGTLIYGVWKAEQHDKRMRSMQHLGKRRL